jgi:broad specificity phosphatase PhoE
MGVPVGKAITSNLNRAYQTAKLAGIDNIEKTADVTESGHGVEDSENVRRAAALRSLASTPPAAGSNVLIVTHKPNIVDAFGMDWAGVKEGEASIFKPAGDKPVLVARVQISDWPRIAAAK